MEFFDFDCAGAVIRVERSLADMSRPRVHLGAFAVETKRTPPALTIERHPALPESARIAEGPLGSCRFELEDSVMRVEVPDGMFPGELVLRLCWYLVTTRLGGVLIHASAPTDGTRAIVAAGKSGDGKSTLARKCRARGLGLLTDEIVQLFPDGTCAGTPFRSDEDNIGQPGRVQATHFVALRKAETEALEGLAPLDAAQLATSQSFDGSVLALPRVETNRRLLGFLSRTTVATLAFRKDPAVGDFVRGLWR